MTKRSADSDATTLDMVLLFAMPVLTAVVLAVVYFLGTQSAALAS